MSYRNLEIQTSVANSTNKEDIICALCELSEFDNDFTGENGDEYLWECTTDEGYNSNAEYLSDHIESTEYVDVIDEFLHKWLDGDSFYGGYEYEINKTDDGKVFIALSYLH